MSVPGFLSGGFYYESVPAGYTDTQLLMDRLELIVTTVLAPSDRWSVITAAATTDGRWRTPTVGGRFSDLRIIRITAARMQVRVIDQNGNELMSRAMDISASTLVEFFVGPLYCFIMNQGVSEEFLLLNLHDLTGIPGAVANYTVGHANRTFAGAISQGTIGRISRWENGAPTHLERIMSPKFSGTTDDYWLEYQSIAGSRAFGPIRAAINEAGAERQGGPIFQCVWVDAAIFGIRADIIVPIDDSVTATFRAVNISNAGDPTLRIAYRKA